MVIRGQEEYVEDSGM